MAILKSRLLFKILSSYVLLLAGVLAAMHLYVAYRVRQDNVNLQRERLLSVAGVLARLLPYQPEDAIPSWVNALGNETGLRITLIDEVGTVVADNQGNPSTMDNHSNRPEVAEARAKGSGSSVRFSRTLGKDELYVALRLADNPGRPQMLRLALPLQEVSQEFRNAPRGLVLISLLFFALACALGYFFTRPLTDRIENIQKFSEKVAAGNLDARIREPATDELGRLASSLNSTADALEQTIRELRDQKNRVAAILEGMRAGVLATDAQGRVTLMNPTLARVLQADLQSCLGRKVIEIVRDADLKKIFDRVLQERREVTATVDMTLASARSFDVVAVPLPEDGPASGGVVAVLHDITRLKKLENIRRDFVANVSHELRTPLTSIRGFAETLLEGALEDSQNNRRFVEIIKAHALRLSDLTKDLLTLAALEAESFQLNREPVDLPSLIGEVAESVRPLCAQKGQQVSVEIGSGLPRLQADRDRLRQVLINLLDNAVKFTPEGGRICLRAEQSQDLRSVVVRVGDSGIGIPQADLPRVFERFYRVDRARSRDQGGTGLGLAIVKHIVEAHHGTVRVTSTPGRGSEFCVTLPVEAEAKQ